MDHFIDFNILGKTGSMENYISAEDVLQRQFRMIHGWLGGEGNGEVGLYFPDYFQNSLGLKIRLVGDKEKLKSAKEKCSKINCVNVSQVQPIPDTTCPLSVNRIQFYTMAQERRLAKRAEKRGEHPERVREINSELQRFPKIKGILTTSGEVIPAMAIKQEKVEKKREGTFNSYGLGCKNGATVPFF